MKFFQRSNLEDILEFIRNKQYYKIVGYKLNYPSVHESVITYESVMRGREVLAKNNKTFRITKFFRFKKEALLKKLTNNKYLDLFFSIFKTYPDYSTSKPKIK